MRFDRVSSRRAPEIGSSVGGLFAAIALFLMTPSAAYAETVDLATLLANSGFEDDLVHSSWTATKKSNNYLLNAPVVNPVIVPKGETDALDAPSGDNFVGVLNPGDQDINGRVVHQPVAGVFARLTTFKLTLFANRGRLAGAATPLFESVPSEVTLQLLGWGAGSVPVVNPNTDDWSRKPLVVISQSFTAWGPNGEWASQIFQFQINTELRYVSLAITGKNHKRASYAAFDVLVVE